MTALDLQPYDQTSGPPAGSVPISVIVLTKNESMNIQRCLASTSWAAQQVVVDSGSTDGTPSLASASGAVVLHHEWEGFAVQREWALRHPVIEHEWIFFVDADEWTSPRLACEVSDKLDSGFSAFRLRNRLVFCGRWMRHSGWYSGSWVIRLMKRSHAHYDPRETVSERAIIDGPVGELRNDLVDDDRKGLPTWLRKHLSYAELKARRRVRQPALRAKLDRFTDTDRQGIARTRFFAKEFVFPLLPAKPIALFLYMYIFRMGFLDGSVGLRFCLLHAWHEYTVGVLVADQRRAIPQTQNEGSISLSSGQKVWSVTSSNHSECVEDGAKAMADRGRAATEKISEPPP